MATEGVCNHASLTTSPEGSQVCELCGVIIDSMDISNLSSILVDSRAPKQPKSTNKRDLRSREDISAYQLKRSLNSINSALNIPINLIEQCLEITETFMSQNIKPLGPMGRLQLSLGYLYLKCKVMGVPLTLTQLSHYSNVSPARILQSQKELITQFPTLQSIIVSPVNFYEKQLLALGLPAFGPLRETATELFSLCEHLATGRKPESLSLALILVAIESQEQTRFSIQQLQEKCAKVELSFTAVYERYREVKQNLQSISKLPFPVDKDTLHLYVAQLIQLSHLYPSSPSLPPSFLQAQLSTKEKEERIRRARRRLSNNNFAEAIEDETDLFIEELLHQGYSDSDILNYLKST